MRRWLFIFVLMLMPLQTAWSAASVYCTHHEEGEAAMHFGHHSDGHGDEAESGTHTASGGHPQGHHHDGSFAIIAVQVSTGEIPSGAYVLLSEPSPRLSSPVGRIERPKWTRLA